MKAFKTLMFSAVVGASFVALPAMAQKIETTSTPSLETNSTPGLDKTTRPPVNSSQTGADPSQATPPMARRGAAGAGANGSGG
jgi:hypothetical protein